MRVKVYYDGTDKDVIYTEKVYTKNEVLAKIENLCDKNSYAEEKYYKFKKYCKKHNITLLNNVFYSKRQLGCIKLFLKTDLPMSSVVATISNFPDITPFIYPCFIKNKDIFNVYKSYDKTKERENLFKKLYTNIINILNYYSECNSFSKQALTYLDSLLKIIRPMNYNFDYLILEKKK